MIGTYVRTVKKVPAWYWFVLAMSLIFILAGLGSSSFIAFAIGIVALSLFLAGVFCAESRVVMEFQEQGIIVHPEHLPVDYVSLKAVAAVAMSKRKKNPNFYELDIATHDFAFRVPANTDVSTSAIEHFLVDKLSPFIDLPQEEDIATFYTEQTAKHGASDVHIFHGRVRPRRMTSAWRIVKFTLFPVIASLLLIFLGNVIRFRARVLSAEILGFVIFAFFVISMSFMAAMWTRKATYKLLKIIPEKTSLVVSPDGFALCQGSLKGKITWNQILGFEFKYGSGMTISGQQNVFGVLNVKIDGSLIPIMDAYDRSLSYIEDVMRSYAFRQPLLVR